MKTKMVEMASAWRIHLSNESWPAVPILPFSSVSHYATIFFLPQKRELCFQFAFVIKSFSLCRNNSIDILHSFLSVEKSEEMNWRASFSVFESHTHPRAHILSRGHYPVPMFPPLWNCQRKDVTMQGNESWGKLCRRAVGCYKCHICFVGMHKSLCLD
jgi:hypothetical protein